MGRNTWSIQEIETPPPKEKKAWEQTPRIQEEEKALQKIQDDSFWDEPKPKKKKKQARREMKVAERLLNGG